METTKCFLPIEETADLTGLSSFFIRQGVRDGWIPHIKCGNKVMINMRLFINILDNKSTEEAANE